MHTKLGVLSIFSLIVLMITPAYAGVNSVTIDKAEFDINDKFTVSGTITDADRVTLLASMKGPGGSKLTRTAMSDHDTPTFSFTPVSASDLFKTKGIYTINVFTEFQRPENGTSIKLEYSSSGITLLPDYVLELKEIGNQQVDETKKLSFTASVTDFSIEDIEYSLEKHPSGTTINKDTGEFSWTPNNTQSGGYVFDIVVKSGPLEDRETITVTVNDKPEAEVTQPSEDDQVVCPQGAKPVDGKCPDKPVIESTEKELEIPAPFVDESKNPQSYVDRYNSETRYKEWFDVSYPEYSSIYEAVGLEEPKELAPFVDPNKDPQHYIDRYNNEITYKQWFDKTYPEYISIYEAVGLEEPIVEEPEFGECGEGTKLIDGKCTVVATKSEGGGCLIATATYGSEMAPQVQFLREIRDNQLMNTDSGISFMTGFNQLYYSFSPTIADMQREIPVFKEVVKIGITPLLSSLSLMSHAESESEVLGYGIGVILMNVGMYFVAPAMLFYGIRKVRRARF